MISKIKSHFGECCRNINILYYDCVESTNTLLIDMANNGAAQGTVVIANEQTAGRGRMNRSFYSPSDTGIYMSILLRPNLQAQEALALTTAAAVAVAKAVEPLQNSKAVIKWVNDVYINEKKICGILTEGSINPDTLNFDYAIVGIGINLFFPNNNFPNEIKDIAGCVINHSSDVEEIKSKVIAETLNIFMDYYNNLPDKSFFEEYKNRSFILGKEIFVVEGEKYTPATALDIDSDCRLIVKFKDGNTQTLSSGEVSIKLESLRSKPSF